MGPIVANTMIESLGVALPERFVSTQELVAGCRHSLDFDLEATTGISELPALPDGQFARDIAAQAVASCLSRSRYTASEVDLLISCTLLNHDQPRRVTLEPTTSSTLQRQFGFENALTFDVSCACAGLFVGLLVADSFLRSGSARTVLICSGEHVSHGWHLVQQIVKSGSDPHMPCLTIGDSGAALMLDAGSLPELGLRDLQLLTLGRYSNHCVAQPTPQAPGGYLMRTDTVRLALVTCREGMAHFERARAQAAGNPALGGFDYFVPHQASSATLQGVMRDTNRRFGPDTLTEDNTLNNLARRGNTITTTHFVAIYDAIRAGRVQNGDRLVLSTVASGATIGSALYYLDDLPERLRNAQSERLTPARNAVGASATDEASVCARHFELERPLQFDALSEAPEPHSGQKTLTLAKGAARQCLREAQVPRQEVAWLVFAGVYKSDFVVEPAMAAFLAGELRINDSSAASERRTFAFDINDGACGFLSACLVVAKLLTRSGQGHALVVTGEGEVALAPGSRQVPPSAHAALLSLTDSRRGFECFGSYQFPHHARALTSCVQLLDEGGAALERHQSPEVSRCISSCINEALARFFAVYPAVRETASFLVLPKVGHDYARAVTDRFNLPSAITVLHADRDLLSSTLPAQILQLLRQHQPAPGTLGVFVCAGAGMKVCCASYRF